MGYKKMNKQAIFERAININSIELFKKLILSEKVDPSKNINYPIRLATQLGHIDIVKLLLLDKRVNPADKFNSTIDYAYEKKYIELVDLLWSDIRVKQTLENHNSILYQILIKKDIKNKVSKF